MKRKFLKSLLCICVLSMLNISYAKQEVNIPTLIKVDHPANFSIKAADKNTKWDFGNGNFDQGSKVSHTYNQAGNYQVEISNSSEEHSQEIQVYNKINLIITDQQNQTKYLNSLKTISQENNNQLIELNTESQNSPFLTQEILLEKLNKFQTSNFQKIDNIIVWTNNNNGINSLIQYLSKNKNLTTHETNLLVIDNNFSNKTRLIRQQRRLQAKNMYVIKSPGVYSFADSANFTEFQEKLDQNLIEHIQIKPESYIYNPLKFLSLSVDYLSEKGIPENLLQLLLILPLVCFLISFFKQVVGLSTIGVYLPTVLTICFLILGLKSGSITMLIVFAISSIISLMLNQIRLLYAPKTSLVIMLTGTLYIMLMSLLIKFNLIDFYPSASTIFPLIIIISMSEKFANIVNSKGLKSCISVTAETYLVIVASYILCGGAILYGNTTFQLSGLNALINNYPETILIIGLLLLLIGRYTGLQVSEYFKFRKILDNIEE